MKKILFLHISFVSLISYAGGYGFECRAKDQNDNKVLIEFYYDNYVGFIEKNGDSTHLYDDLIACGLKRSSQTICNIEMKYKTNGDATFSSKCTFKNKPIEEMNGHLEWSEMNRSGYFICGVLPSHNLVLEKCDEIGPK